MITKYNNPEKGNLQQRERSLAIWGKFQMDEQAGGTKQHTFTTSVPRDQDEHSKGGKRSHTPRDGCDLPVAQLALGEPAPRI